MSDPEDDEALRLNTLHRFRKHSPRLLLQEYSHCEVPAGCGGVVLRCIDREAGLPVILRMAALAPIRCFVDGEAMTASTLELGPGRHALAIELRELPRANTPLLARVDVNFPGDNQTLVCTDAGDPWWTSTTPPLGAWMQPGYDPLAHAWSRAIEHPNYEAELPESLRWQWRSLANHARPIVLPATQVWLRCEFTTSAEVIAGYFAQADADDDDDDDDDEVPE